MESGNLKSVELDGIPAVMVHGFGSSDFFIRTWAESRYACPVVLGEMKSFKFGRDRRTMSAIDLTPFGSMSPGLAF